MSTDECDCDYPMDGQMRVVGERDGALVVDGGGPPLQGWTPPNADVAPVVDLILYRASRAEHQRRRRLSALLMIVAAAVIFYLVVTIDVEG